MMGALHNVSTFNLLVIRLMYSLLISKLLLIVLKSVFVLNLKCNALCEVDITVCFSSVYLSFVLYVLVNPMYRIFCP